MTTPQEFVAFVLRCRVGSPHRLPRCLRDRQPAVVRELHRQRPEAKYELFLDGTEIMIRLRERITR